MEGAQTKFSYRGQRNRFIDAEFMQGGHVVSVAQCAAHLRGQHFAEIQIKLDAARGDVGRQLHVFQLKQTYRKAKVQEGRSGRRQVQHRAFFGHQLFRCGRFQRRLFFGRGGYLIVFDGISVGIDLDRNIGAIVSYRENAAERQGRHLDLGRQPVVEVDVYVVVEAERKDVGGRTEAVVHFGERPVRQRHRYQGVFGSPE